MNNKLKLMLDHLDTLEKVDAGVWFNQNKVKLIELLVDLDNENAGLLTVTVEKIANRMPKKGVIKKEIELLMRAERIKRVDKSLEEHFKDGFKPNFKNRTTKGIPIADQDNIVQVLENSLHLSA